MKVVKIEEEGRSIQCYEGDFVCLEQMIEDAMEILIPYGCPVALQYLKMARQLVHERKTEIFGLSSEKSTG